MQVSAKKVGVANGGTTLPFLQLSKKASEADTFEEFATLLLSVGKTADDVNVYI